MPSSFGSTPSFGLNFASEACDSLNRADAHQSAHPHASVTTSQTMERMAASCEDDSPPPYIFTTCLNSPHNFQKQARTVMLFWILRTSECALQIIELKRFINSS